MILITTSQALLLRNAKFKYDISPGTYQLEKKVCEKTIWLMLIGMPYGLPLEEWQNLKGKLVFPANEKAKEFF